jgi:hypothetical protein
VGVFSNLDDDDFLAEIGMSWLDDSERNRLLLEIAEELELRIGEALAEGLTDAQIAEYEALTERDETRVLDWLNSNVPGYEESDQFDEFLKTTSPDKSSIDVISDYAALQWLQIHRPDYQDISASIRERLYQEICERFSKVD